MEVNISLSKSYQEVFTTDKNMIVLIGGRVGGKTYQITQGCLLQLLETPFSDGIIARASYGSLRDSVYAEMTSAIEKIDGLSQFFNFRQAPLRIEKIDGSNIIYFVGYGGSNFSRTKGIKTKHKIKFVIFEETQELKDKRSLDEAIATFRRNYGEDVKVYLLGNPPPAKAHWFNMFVEECKRDKDYFVKQVTYLDILPYLNDFDLKDILKTKKKNLDYYKWFYLGDCVGGFGSVYPMFLPEKYCITNMDFNIIRNQLKIIACVIGGDGAVTHDATSFVPLLILNNGQAIVGDIFHQDPQENGVIGSHILVQNEVMRWFNKIIDKYQLGKVEDARNNYYGANQIIPIFMRIDSASTDLIQECRFFFGDRADVDAISKSTVMEMTSSVQSAISNDMVYIVDDKKLFNWHTNRESIVDMNILAKELSLLIWNEKQTGYDPTVPNDDSDAFTYAIRFWYSNIENIGYFNIAKSNELNLPLISSLIKERE